MIFAIVAMCLWIACGIVHSVCHIVPFPHCCHCCHEMLHHNDPQSIKSNVIYQRKWSHFVNVLIRYYLTHVFSMAMVVPMIFIAIFVWFISFIYHFMIQVNQDSTSTNLIVSKSEQATCTGTPCTRKKICIIGAGPSGLVTAKYMLSKGFEVTLYERSDMVGGSFARAYNGELTSSNFLTQFSDFAIKECDLLDDTYNDNDNEKDCLKSKDVKSGFERKKERINFGTFLSFNEYCGYLTRYAKYFDIWDKIKFNTNVNNVAFDKQKNEWKITITNDNDHNNNVETRFDHLCVCTGIADNNNATIPQSMMNNITSKNVEYYHSSHFYGNLENDKRLSNKNILIIGSGESGSDISYKISKICEKYDKKCCLLTRNNNSHGIIIPKFSNGLSSDIDTSRMYHTSRQWGMSLIIKFKRWLESFYVTPFDDTKCYKQAKKINQNKSPFEHFGTKNYGIIKAVVYRKLILIENDENEDRISDEMMSDVINKYGINAIVFCTGYESSISILNGLNIGDNDICCSKTVSSLYYHMFDIKNYGNKLILIGFNRPMIGSLIPLSEMSAKYASMIVNGEKQLPPFNGYNTSLQQRKLHFPCHYDNKPVLKDFLTTYEELANEIGCSINLWYLFTFHPFLWYHVLAKPLQCVQYNIFENGKIIKDKAKLNDIYLQISQPPAIARIVLLFEFISFCCVNISQIIKDIRQ